MPIAWAYDVFPVYSTQGIEDADVETMIENIHSQGFGTFYLLANEETSQEIQTKVTSQYTKKEKVKVTATKILKCTKNIVGSSVSAISQESFPLGAVKPQAFYNLPKMSKEFVDRLDSFFRHVHSKYKTEAIVVFTYDETYLNTDNPSDGWGVAVPKQENTAASCDYDQQSILDILPDDYDHIYQVGTAHSHPMMDAYCSGTDKADQASFDGVHITFGWKGPVTDHHIELQMGDTAWTLRPEQVFEMDDYVVDDKVESWSKQVTKKTFTGTSGGATPLGSGKQTTGSGKGLVGMKYMSQQEADRKAKSFLPEAVGEPRNNTIIYSPLVNVDHLVSCPVCTNEYVSKESRRCYKCMTFFMDAQEDIEDLIKIRKAKFPTSYHEIDPEADPAKAIWLVEEEWDKDNKEIFIYQMLHPGVGQEHVKGVRSSPRKGGSDTQLDDEDLEVFAPTTSHSADDEPIFDYVICEDCGVQNETHAWQCIECEGFAFAAPGVTLPRKSDNAYEEESDLGQS